MSSAPLGAIACQRPLGTAAAIDSLINLTSLENDTIKFELSRHSHWAIEKIGWIATNGVSLDGD